MVEILLLSRGKISFGDGWYNFEKWVKEVILLWSGRPTASSYYLSIPIRFSYWKRSEVFRRAETETIWKTPAFNIDIDRQLLCWFYSVDILDGKGCSNRVWELRCFHLLNILTFWQHITFSMYKIIWLSNYLHFFFLVFLVFLFI